MTPQEMTELTKQVSQLVDDRGTTQTVIVIVLVVLVASILVGLNEYIKGKQEARKEAEEKRKLDIERNRNYVEIIERITNSMAQNTYRVDDFSKKIEAHQNYSNQNFKNINKDLKDIKKDLSVVSNMEDKMVTQEGLEKVEEKVDRLIKTLE